MRLSGLLRSVLRSAPEFSTLGEELKIIVAYLEIERARFEERLVVHAEVSEELQKMRIPTLLLQPLVENAVKHGISKRASGGTLRISARLIESASPTLLVTVEDTGAGADEASFAAGRTQGVGLNNVEKRLQCYSNGSASMQIQSRPGHGTTIEITLPAEPADANAAVASSRVG
jgi:sensor histidine kinase YesM